MPNIFVLLVLLVLSEQNTVGLDPARGVVTGDGRSLKLLARHQSEQEGGVDGLIVITQDHILLETSGPGPLQVVQGVEADISDGKVDEVPLGPVGAGRQLQFSLQELPAGPPDRSWSTPQSDVPVTNHVVPPVHAGQLDVGLGGDDADVAGADGGPGDVVDSPEPGGIHLAEDSHHSKEVAPTEEAGREPDT